MKLRRIQNSHSDFYIQAYVDNHWIQFSAINNLKQIADKYELTRDLATDVLAVCNLPVQGKQELINALTRHKEDKPEDFIVTQPLAPTSFRDFMLFEQHTIDSTRGYVRRFMPKLLTITNLIESITRKPFKRFKPHALWYQQPIYYFSNHLNIGVDGDNVVWPKYSKALDYELELGAILSKPLFNATAKEAEAAIGGFVILNDFSARDVQKDEMASGFGPQKAKHFFSTISSTFVTADEILPQINDLNASVCINGQTVASCSTQNMKYSIAEVIAFASQGEQLHPGELFGSGTLAGGSGMETNNWLSIGDTLTLKIDQIGELSNQIVSGV